jgi:hypothetical protein
MTLTSRTARLALASVLTVVLVLAVAALAGATPGKGKGKGKGNGGKSSSPSASQYQYGPSGKQYGKTKVTICHKGKTITVGAPAVKAHLKNHQGDHVGAC